jgi:hypothetical protein
LPRLQASRRHRFSLRTAALAVHLLDRFLAAYKIQARGAAQRERERRELARAHM